MGGNPNLVLKPKLGYHHVYPFGRLCGINTLITSMHMGKVFYCILCLAQYTLSGLVHLISDMLGISRTMGAVLRTANFGYRLGYRPALLAWECH